MSNAISNEQLEKLLQIYMLQNLYSNIGSDDIGYSSLFSVVLENMIKDITTKSSSLTQSVQKAEKPSEQCSISTARSNSVNNNVMAAIKDTASKYGVDSDLIKAIVKNESSFNPNAVSSCGAEGLMQLMPSTARSLGVSNSFDVLENLDGGTRYFKNLLEAFDGNAKLALSAYNGGISRMNRLGVDTVEKISKMPKETINYVDKVMKSYNEYKKSH